MADIFGYSLKRFYALEGEGTFIWAEERPRIGNRKAWLRALVERHLNGEAIDVVSRKRQPQGRRLSAKQSGQPLHSSRARRDVHAAQSSHDLPVDSTQSF